MTNPDPILSGGIAVIYGELPAVSHAEQFPELAPISFNKSLPKIYAGAASLPLVAALFGLLFWLFYAFVTATTGPPSRGSPIVVTLVLVLTSFAYAIVVLSYATKRDPLVTLSSLGLRASPGVLRKASGFGADPLLQADATIPWSNIRLLPAKSGSYAFVVSETPNILPIPPPRLRKPTLHAGERMVFLYGVFKTPLREVVAAMERFKRDSDKRTELLQADPSPL